MQLVTSPAANCRQMEQETATKYQIANSAPPKGSTTAGQGSREVPLPSKPSPYVYHSQSD